MSQTYNYKISDTANDKVNSELLTEEINASAISTGVLEAISTVDAAPPNDDLDITFDVALSAGDKTTLDGVVAAHQGTNTIERIQRQQSTAIADNLTNVDIVKVTLTTLPHKAGLYFIQWYAEIRVSDGSLGDRCQATVETDGSNVGECNAFDANWLSMSGYDPIVLAEGDAPVTEIMWRLVGGGGDTAQIRRARLAIVSMNE
jgi:hypothetical protein